MSANLKGATAFNKLNWEDAVCNNDIIPTQNLFQSLALPWEWTMIVIYKLGIWMLRIHTRVITYFHAARGPIRLKRDIGLTIEEYHTGATRYYKLEIIVV